MISLQKKSLFFRFLQRMDVEVLNRFLALLDKNDGRDKVCKIVQYTLKLVLVWQENYYKPRVGKLAKQLSETRRILRISRFLKCKDSLKEAFMEQKALVSYVSLCSAGVGTLSNIADDVCWASDIGILPQWVRRIILSVFFNLFHHVNSRYLNMKFGEVTVGGLKCVWNCQ